MASRLIEKRSCYLLLICFFHNLKVNWNSRVVNMLRECALTCAWQGGSAQTFFGVPKKINTRKNQSQKNKFMKITDPKKWVLCAICAIRLNFLSSIFSVNFKSQVMNHWVVYFYLHSLMLLFEWFCKSRSFNRTPKKINCIKIATPKNKWKIFRPKKIREIFPNPKK